MNPLEWKREHQLALLLALAIGVGVGIAFAYMVYAVGQSDAYSFSSWLSNNLPYYRFVNCVGNACRSNWHMPRYYGAAGWGIFGGAIGAAIIYIKRLIAK